MVDARPGFDWSGLLARHRTEVASAGTPEEVHAAVNGMLAELRISHLGLLDYDVWDRELAGEFTNSSRAHAGCELVEIGGSFRLPEVMAASGAKLVEVGTTNKTHPRDYERAITENTAAILRVHPSNYKIVGFTAEVPLSVLVRIAHEHRLPLIDDVGAGALIDLARFGFAAEPTLPGSIRAGADVVISYFALQVARGWK